jgi:hypothetical protein
MKCKYSWQVGYSDPGSLIHIPDSTIDEKTIIKTEINISDTSVIASLLKVILVNLVFRL